MKRITRAVLVVVAFVVSGCGAGDDRLSEPVVTEVDGVLHVQLPPHERLGAETWRLRELYTTTDAGLELFRVIGARLLDDGALVIANSGAHEILRLDDGGELEGRFGRQGGGPGEFGELTAIDIDADGNLLVYDRREVRLTRFDPEGEVLETRRLSSEDAVADLRPLGEWSDGRVPSVFGEVRVFGRTGESRDTLPFFAVDPEGAGWDTLGIWPAQEWSNLEFTGGGMTRMEVGFGRTLVHSGRGGRIALGSTDSLDVTVFDETGTESMRIAGWGADEAVEADAVEAWRAQYTNRISEIPDPIRPEFERWVSEVPYRETYPAFGELLVDGEGQVWIGPYPRDGEPQEWLVVGEDGSVVAELTIPAGARVLDAVDGRVVLLERSELDEEIVVVAEIEAG